MRFALLILAVLIIPAAKAQNLFNCPIFADDIENFWNAFDELEKDTSRNPFEHYLVVASPGLTDMNQYMIGGAAKLKKHVLKRIDFYRSIRERSRSWSEYHDRIDYVSQKMASLIQGARYPNIYFVIGIENSGGTMSVNGVIVGIETLCYSPDFKDPMGHDRSMENLPETIALMIAYYNESSWTENSLLQRAVSAGAAQFFSELLIKDLHIRNTQFSVAKAYGEEHVCQLWNEFVPDRNKKESGNWFYQYKLDRPANLGEWIGYKIITEYIKENKSKPDVMADVLDLTKMKNFAEEKMVTTFCK